MGYSIVAYALDLDALRIRIQAKDPALLDSVRKQVEAQTENFEEYLEAANDPEPPSGPGFFGRLFGKKAPEPAPAPQEPITGMDAMRHLLFDEPKNPDAWTAYGYLFEIVCEVHGTRLFARGFESIRSSSGWVGIVDKALAKHLGSKSSFRLEETFLARGLPLNGLPEADDFPYCGYLEANEAKALAAALREIDLDQVAAATGHPAPGREAMNGLVEMVEECENSGRAVVTFYY